LATVTVTSVPGEAREGCSLVCVGSLKVAQSTAVVQVGELDTVASSVAVFSGSSGGT